MERVKGCGPRGGAFIPVARGSPAGGRSCPRSAGREGRHRLHGHRRQLGGAAIEYYEDGATLGKLTDAVAAARDKGGCRPPRSALRRRRRRPGRRPWDGVRNRAGARHRRPGVRAMQPCRASLPAKSDSSPAKANRRRETSSMTDLWPRLQPPHACCGAPPALPQPRVRLRATSPKRTSASAWCIPIPTSWGQANQALRILVNVVNAVDGMVAERVSSCAGDVRHVAREGASRCSA